MESFRGGGGEAIGGRTAGPANTQDSGADIVGFANPVNGLVSVFVSILQFILLAAVAITLAVFIYGSARGRSFTAGLNSIRAFIPK